jgi:flagellar basal-body rod protein FlgC
MDLMKSMQIAASGMRAQSGRMRIVAENIANANSTATTADGDPYRRKIPTFKQVYDNTIGANVVKAGRIKPDMSEFKMRYEPGHPAADANGYIKAPNVNSIIEMADMREAQRSYEANLNVINSSRQMLLRTLDILKG